MKKQHKIKGMFRKFLTAIALLLATGTLAYGQSGALKGKITDKESGEPVPFANIIVEAGGRQAGGTTTDIDGNYTIKPLPPGKYDVKASYVGYKPILIRGVEVNSDKVRFLNVEMQPTSQTLEEFEVVDYKVPLINKDQTSSGETVTSEEISKLPGRSATSVVATVGGVFSEDGEMGSIRGARTEGTVTYIDGVRVRGTSSVPKSALEQVSVITGGTPARYGDATGGIVNITTKGPSRNFGAGGELVTSQFLDNYGYNLFGFNVQGPVLKSKDSTKNTALLGFMLSGEVRYQEDPRPFNIDIWKATDETMNYLEENPFRPTGTGFGAFYNAQYLRKNDLYQTNDKEYADNFSINLNGKIDVRTSDNTNLTFGGSVHYRSGYQWSLSNSLLNAENNGTYEDNTMRFYGRFTQRFPTSSESRSLIKNVFYSIQADYSRYHQTVQDGDHQDNLFNYGYVGDYKTHKIESYELGSDTTLGLDDVWVHNGFQDTLVTFEPGSMNEKIASYTSAYYDLYDINSGLYANKELIQQGQGLLNGETPNSVYGIYTNLGTPYGSYSKSENQQFTINANGSADIGNHEIKFGLQYEQRIDRYIGYNAIGLWTLMRQMANKHIEQLDLANPKPVYDAYNVFQDSVRYDRLYDEESQSSFDASVREKLGLAVDGLDWIDIDNLDPSFFSIDMFSADELLNGGNQYVSYYGYDYTGEAYGTKPSFEDFFTKTDDDDFLTRPIAAFEPIYMAGYIQDKFAFDDLIFNIGVRVDRYDANQKVLKDPFLLYEAKTVNEVNDLGAHPSNMGDDYVVYVDDYNNPSAVLGYRDESTWYNAQGSEINDPAIIESGTGINPYLVNPDANEISATAFEDYDPQINVMPRISFSFPISDEALFFAHYDVLTKRPTTGNRLDVLDYYFIESRGQSVLNNPNLKPERTTDYEVGFQQKLTNSSSVKFSSYYREMRNMVQAFPYTGAYPIDYISYSNLDFGTVKGLTVSYDLRRSSNLRFRANYTLQFASGTGSSATTSYSLIASGQPNLRTTNPLSFDRRHMVKFVADYRFKGGKNYEGPSISRTVVDENGEKRVKTTRILENTGINMTFNGGSGKPYTTNSDIYSALLGGGAQVIEGSINGSRLPWSFTIDARIDRDIMLGKERKTYLNVYLQVLNVLNSQNILNVYNATGNPDDDGFLSAAEFQQQIQTQNDPQSFRDLYSIRINNPYNYSLPRRIRLGIAFNF
ncbi:MAG: carboxypeptidase regulatory-like domain-containing protein [Bacteroidota bacterium]